MTNDFYTFGCPVLVLCHQLHNNQSLKKIESQVQTGAFLGWSKKHACSIALVLNPTDHISMQYHVIFDNKFEIIPSSTSTSQIEQ